MGRGFRFRVARNERRGKKRLNELTEAANEGGEEKKKRKEAIDSTTPPVVARTSLEERAIGVGFQGKRRSCRKDPRKERSRTGPGQGMERTIRGSKKRRRAAGP